MRAASLVAIALCCVLAPASAKTDAGPPVRLSSPAVPPLFEMYDRGDYEAFDLALAPFSTVLTNWYEFEMAATQWVAQASGAARERRRLVAASVGLEIAYVQRGSWEYVAMLVEVGCELLREQPPSEAERWWQLASLTLAQGVSSERFIEDNPFYDLDDGGEPPSLEVVWRRKEREREPQRKRIRLARERAKAGQLQPLSSIGWINHLGHAMERYPSETAWQMAAAVEAETRMDYQPMGLTTGGVPTWPRPQWIDPAPILALVKSNRGALRDIAPWVRMDASTAKEVLKHEPGQRAAGWSSALWQLADRFRGLAANPVYVQEASVREGVTFLKLARPDLALAAFQRAERPGTDPYYTYFARFRAGLILRDNQRHEDAITAFSGALEAVPRAQSATFALVPLLFEAGRRDEAADRMDAALQPPLATDPWKGYRGGDPSRWAVQIAQLRQALR